MGYLMPKLTPKTQNSSGTIWPIAGEVRECIHCPSEQNSVTGVRTCILRCHRTAR